ncbi:hypothetical protein NM688_g6741 [Phlebia brevispora]|uniref:Uncharacterized protein n=1 Tax=Phlebia brevispora TaxID=194682 RepID=A0ACC1SDC2_9APHY|nr:hypothetical protein NM688_g6741 [Phlebia brevispora]
METRTDQRDRFGTDRFYVNKPRKRVHNARQSERILEVGLRAPLNAHSSLSSLPYNQCRLQRPSMASAKLAQRDVSETHQQPNQDSSEAVHNRHETFRNLCVGLAQRMHRAEVELRTKLLGEPAKHVRPLSETRAIDNGANAIAEGFLFTVAAALIIGETWRSSRNQTKRREGVDDRLDELQSSIQQLSKRVDDLARDFDERFSDEKQTNDELSRILERVVEIGLRGGWAEFEDTPLLLPKIQLNPRRKSSDSPLSEELGDAPPTETEPKQ